MWFNGTEYVIYQFSIHIGKHLDIKNEKKYLSIVMVCWFSWRT